MKPTEILMQEHKGILKMMGALGRMCDRLEKGEKIPVADFEQMVDFIRTFTDKCHHMKEEDLLFTAMEEVGFPRHAGPIGVMLMEHDMGRGFVRDLAEGVAQYKAGTAGAEATIAENARNFIALLTSHIDKEDNILYPMADTHLPTEKQQELVREFDRVENEKIGKGKHEEYHKLIHQMVERYSQ